MEKYSQFRDRGILHTYKANHSTVLIHSRFWSRTVFPNSYSTLRHLSSLSSLLTPCSAANTYYCYSDLLRRASMAANWIFGEESITVAHTWDAWSLVDRSSDRWRQEGVCAQPVITGHRAHHMWQFSSETSQGTIAAARLHNCLFLHLST